MIDRVLDWRNLQAAWRAVEAKKGGPGLDEVTLKRWGRNWRANLERLRAQVRTNTYRPTRPRRVRVLKRDGEYRELSILTVTDRVLQRALLNVLEGVFENLFLNCSFGYRPRRSVADAVTSVVRSRERGRSWVLHADIDDCFDSLDHALIGELIAPAAPDAIVRRLIHAWLQAGRPKKRREAVHEGARSSMSNGARARNVGVPQGAVISPLLCNVVLHELDMHLTRAGWALVRYADDFVVLTSTEAEAHVARADVELALSHLRLRLNAAKTRVVSFEQGFRFLGVDFLGDAYSYVHNRKRLTVSGPTVRVLRLWPPEYY